MTSRDYMPLLENARVIGDNICWKESMSHKLTVGGAPHSQLHMACCTHHRCHIKCTRVLPSWVTGRCAHSWLALL
jgi:hypothetical protein